MAIVIKDVIKRCLKHFPGGGSSIIGVVASAKEKSSVHSSLFRSCIKDGLATFNHIMTLGEPDDVR